MSDTITLTMTLYGGFRAYVGDAPLALTLPAGSTLADVRRGLADEIRRRHPGFSNAQLIATSAFADEEQLLRDDTPVKDGASVAVLPPICGG